MNHHKIKVILFGMGIMGKQITRFLADKNVPVVAAVGRRSHIGEDIGELSGIGPSGVSLLAGPDIDLEEVIKASGANVAIHCSANLEEIADQICCCLENGLNVITLSEDAYFPFVENLKTYKRLNDAALRNRVTLVGLHIMPGQTMGSIQCTELMTAENITLTGKICWAYGAEGATGIDKWTFRGIPSFEVITDDPAPFFGTAIDAVLRIPDVMKAEPGFITVKDLPKPRYLHGDLDDYV